MRAVALLGLLAVSCAPPPKTTSFAVHPAGVSGERIAHRAVLFDQGDIPVLRKAGGLPVGSLTMQGEWTRPELETAVAKAAAEHGGTHYMPGTWTGSPASWSVTPVAPTTTNASFVVVRVPANAWHRIPPGIVPEPYAGID
ncbi:MAG: hypothetical protein ACXWUG_00650 [Polyangiales bacterium]